MRIDPSLHYSAVLQQDVKHGKALCRAKQIYLEMRYFLPVNDVAYLIK